MSIGSTRRGLLLAAAAASSLPPRAWAAEATWPARTIRIIVPFAPGASIDAIARILAPKLTAALGQAVVVENRAGAGGVIGSGFVARQPPDGYTLLFTSNPFVIAPLLLPANQRASYEPGKDFQPIAEVATAPLIITVSGDVKPTSLRDLFALAAATPEGLTYGSGGVGTINHLAMEMLAGMAGIKLIHVPFGGLGPAITALLGGQVQIMAGTIPSVLPLVRDGRIRALAVTSAQRSPLLPDLPTVTESGIAGYELDAWWGLLGPAGMPVPVVERLNNEVGSLLKGPDLQHFLTLEGAVPRPGSPGDFAALIQSEIPRWRQVVRDAHITG